MRRIVVLFADTHGGHKLALMPPDVGLDDVDEQGRKVQWTPRQTAVQRWLWDCYQEDMAAVKKLAGRSEVIPIHDGDITWGRKYPEALVSGREADQYAIAVANMKPWLEWRNVKTMRLMHGTESHEFGQGSSTIRVASELQTKYAKKSIEAVRHGMFVVDGVRIDVAHRRPGPGMRIWTSGNQLRYYLRSLMMTDILDGKEPPRVVVGAHFHTYKHEIVTVQQGEKEWVGDIIILPSYCGMSSYAHHATQSAHILTCGLIACIIEDGRLMEIKPFKRSVDLRTEERL